MKLKKITVFFLLGFAFAASASAAKKWSLTDFGSIAVVGISGNKNISEKYAQGTRFEQDEESDDSTLINSAIDKVFYKDDIEPLTGQDRVDYAEDYMRYALETIAEMKVADPNTVLESNSYKKIVKNPFNALEYKTNATGYTKNTASYGGKASRDLMKEIGVNSIVSANFKFSKVYDRQSKLKCNAVGEVVMSIVVHDGRGRQVLLKDYTAVSTEKIPVRKFKYNQEDLIALYPDLIENVINQFIMEYLN